MYVLKKLLGFAARQAIMPFLSPKTPLFIIVAFGHL
jgi:hypothetical protein